MRACTAPIQAPNSALGFAPMESKSRLLCFAVITIEPGERLEHFAFQHLDLLLRGFQSLLTEARELEPAAMRGKRLLQAQAAAFHLGNDSF